MNVFGLVSTGFLTGGLSHLLLPSEMEVSLGTYQAMKGVPSASATTIRPIASVAPTKGGGALTLGFSF
jgi:hypothetical protein